MIYDYLKNLGHYKGLHKNFDKVIDFIAQHPNLADLPMGIHREIDLGFFYNHFEAEFAPLEERCFESHDFYADLHINIVGDELCGYDTISELKLNTEYNVENDYYLYENKPYNLIALNNKQFALFMPGEGHAPNTKNTSTKNEKIVFKIKWTD